MNIYLIRLSTIQAAKTILLDYKETKTRGQHSGHKIGMSGAKARLELDEQQMFSRKSI